MHVDSFSSSSSDGSGTPGKNTSLAESNAKASSQFKSADVQNKFPVNREGKGNLLHEAMKHPTIPVGQKCENCENILKTGEVAISAERAGPVKIWHPRCFTCHECKVITLFHSIHIICF
jgi:hypothetical protein